MPKRLGGMLKKYNHKQHYLLRSRWVWWLPSHRSLIVGYQLKIADTKRSLVQKISKPAKHKSKFQLRHPVLYCLYKKRVQRIKHTSSISTVGIWSTLCLHGLSQCLLWSSTPVLPTRIGKHSESLPKPSQVIGKWNCKTRSWWSVQETCRA